MAQLTPEQKQNLKEWGRSLKIWFVVIMAWIFIISPTVFFVFKNKFWIIWFATEIIFIFLFIGVLVLRHHKKCPNCKARIGGWNKIISLPDTCYKCGVSFK